MTRVIRYCGIGGKASQQRRCALGRTMGAALAALAIGGVTSLAPTGTAIAQTAGTAGPILFGDVFDGPDSVNLKPDAAQRIVNATRRAQAQGDCPMGRFTIYVPDGDELFQPALAAGRRDAVLQLLNSQGMDASRFVADTKFGGTQSNVVLQYFEPWRDTLPPKLQTSSQPPKGTKVKAGDLINITMVAGDGLDHGNYTQSGIKKIQLVVESEGGRVVIVENYPQGCAAYPREQRLEANYTVPSNPPPIIRLRAIAEDFAGNKDTDLGEFPTGGDWHGSIDWWIPAPASRVWGRLDLTVDYDGRGNLKGRMAGDSHVESPGRGEFCGITTETPAKISADLNGQYTPGRNTMSLGITDPQIEQGKYGVCAVGPGGGPLRVSGQWFGGSGPIGQPGFAQLLNNMTVRADGSVEASGEWPVTPAEAQSTLHMKLKLRKAQN